MEIDISAGP